MRFIIQKQLGLARVGLIQTPHGDIATPAFIGAATGATVKALTFNQLNVLGCQAVLANTYHLLLAPGPQLIEDGGGLSAFSSWHKPSFTDSGGFQMLSLPSAVVDDAGVTFKSHRNGDRIRMTPAISMQAQWQIGADIHMAFDQATDSPDHALTRRAMLRTHAWLPQNLREHARLKALAQQTGAPEQALFAVVQGGLFEDLRRESADFMKDQPVDGFGLGSFYTTLGDASALLALTNRLLPVEKPRHFLGMGAEPRDLFLGVKFGCDTFDCVGPTRMARNGALYTPTGRINIKNARFKHDFSPLDPDCGCEFCQNYTKAYLHHLFAIDEITAKVLASIHNVYFVVNTVAQIRQSLLDDTFDAFMHTFLNRYYG